VGQQDRWRRRGGQLVRKADGRRAAVVSALTWMRTRNTTNSTKAIGEYFTHTAGSGDTARLKLNKKLTKRCTTIKHLCVISRLLVLATTKDKSARTDCDDNYSACQSLGKGEIRRDPNRREIRRIDYVT